MTYRSLTQHTISCNNTIRNISNRTKTHPKSKDKIRTQILVQPIKKNSRNKKTYIIGGDDHGSLFYSHLNNLNIRKQKIHTDFIRRVQFYSLQDGTNIILTCSDDGRLNCYELNEGNGLEFKYLFDIDFGIGVNDFSFSNNLSNMSNINDLTKIIFHENSSSEMFITSAPLNIKKNELKQHIEKTVLVGTFFGLRIFQNKENKESKDRNKKLMKAMPSCIYCLVSIGEGMYICGTDSGISIIEISMTGLSVVKSYEFGRCFVVKKFDGYVYCASQDVYEVCTTTYTYKKLNITPSRDNKDSSEIGFFDIAIKREVTHKQNTLRFTDRLLAITETSFLSTVIRKQDFILTDNLKLFVLENNKVLKRCKEMNFLETKTILNFDSPINFEELSISDRIRAKGKVYSILGREISETVNTEVKKSGFESEYEFEGDITQSDSFDNYCLFLVNGILYIFCDGELVLFVECQTYNILNNKSSSGVSQTYLLIDRKYFLHVSANKHYDNSNHEEEQPIDLARSPNTIKNGKHFIFMVKLKYPEFAVMTVKESIGILKEGFIGIDIQKVSDYFKNEILLLDTISKYLDSSTVINSDMNEECISMLESLIDSLIDTDSNSSENDNSLRTKLTDLFFKLSPCNTLLFNRLLKYGSVKTAEEYLRNNEIISSDGENGKLRQVFDKYLAVGEFKDGLRLCTELGIDGDLERMLVIMNEE